MENRPPQPGERLTAAFLQELADLADRPITGVGVQQDKYGTVIMPPPPTTGQPAQPIRRARLTEELSGCGTAGIVLLNPPSGSGGSEGSCLCDYTDGESATVIDDAGLVNEHNDLTELDPAGNFYLPIKEENADGSTSPIILEVQPPSADSQGLWRLVNYGLGCASLGSEGSQGSEGSGSGCPAPCTDILSVLGCDVPLKRPDQTVVGFLALVVDACGQCCIVKVLPSQCAGSGSGGGGS